jgi:hypothetical protein
VNGPSIAIEAVQFLLALALDEFEATALLLALVALLLLLLLPHPAAISANSAIPGMMILLISRFSSSDDVWANRICVG